MNKEAKTRVCEDILRIMKVYHAQDDAGHVDTPGGLEHMGDVIWLIMRKTGQNMTACEWCGNSPAMCDCEPCKECQQFTAFEDLAYGYCPDCYDDLEKLDLEDKLEQAFKYGDKKLPIKHA